MTLVRNPRLAAAGRARRFGLLATTALVGVSLNLAAPALAQTLPIPTGAEVIAGSGEWNNGGAKITTPAANLRTVDLLAKSRIIDFTSYNIDNATVNYISTGGGTSLVAANRVVTAGVSSISSTGRITADPNISVWLINQDGITFNGTATLTGGSLMLSTLDFTGPVNPAFRTAFETTANTAAISFSGSSTDPIKIGGAGLSVSGSIVVIGQDITNTAAVTSTGGSVVMIAGSDVTFTAGLGNPLSFTVNAGTNLGQAAVSVNGDVTGQSVLIAGGLKANLTAALLNVDANATLTASQANGTVTLATATTTVGTNTVSITNGANAAPSILVNGSLAAAGASADVIVNSAAGVTLANDVTAGRDFTATGKTVTLGAAAAAVDQSAGRNVTINATTGAITGLGTLTLASDTGGSGAADLVLKADAGKVDFGADTLLQAGLTGSNPLERSAVRITSAPTITLGDVIGSTLVTGAGTALQATGAITTGDVTVDQALTITSTGGSISTGALTVGNANAAVLLSAAGATSDISSSGTIATNGGNVLLSAERDIGIVDVATVPVGAPTPTGSVGLLAGGKITGGALGAGVDIAARGGTGVAITSATAGDDIDLVAVNGNLSLGTGSAQGTGATTTRVTFTGTPGTTAALAVVAGEDAQLGGSTIRLRSAAGDITSATSLTTLGGDVLVNASNDVSLTTVTTTGGSIAVRAGRDVTKATTLKSNSEDVTVRAGRNAALGTLTALDDIDLNITGNLTFTRLALTGGTDGTRFADVTSGSAGAVGGVTFTTPDDAALAAANVVRVKAGSVGTPGAASNALIVSDAAGNPASGAFSFTADKGDIRIGTATADGTIGVTATLGSVTGLADGYAAPTGGEIAAAGRTVLLDVGSGSFGAITAATLTQVTTPTILRASSITADTINLVASNTLDLGTVRTAGTLTLRTTDGTAASGTALEIINPATKLAPGFGAATLTATPANATITVNAVGGVAQLGTLTAGTGADPDPTTGAAGQITVNAGALTITTALAKDGGIAATASAGLLQIGTGTAKQAITLTKRNLDGTSAGSDTTTDVLRAANLTSNANAVLLLSDTSIDVTTKAKAATDLKLSATKTIGIVTGEATTGSIGLFAGGAITATTLTAGVDISALGGTTGALTKTDVAITSATAGDDIDLAALNGNLSLGTGSAEATGATTTRITFAGAPGTGATIGVAASEDAQLGGSTIRLRSAAGDITSATSLTTLGGDVLVNASNDVSLTTVTATGGSIAVRAGRDVTKATTLKSNSEDVTVGAGRNATLGTLTALDDIDLAITGNLTFTRLALTGGSDGTRFADVISGSAGAVGGVTFNPVDDLALAGANVVRVKAGSVGTPGAEANALIAGDVTSGTFTADASSGDIRLRNVTAAGNLGATATLGSVTGVADGYAATTETNIVDAVGHTVLIDVGSGAFGTINAGSVKTVTSGANVLRINNIDAGTVSLAASNTLDVGTIVATGLVDLKTTGGTAASGTALEIINPATKLAPGFGAATLTATPANATITVSAVGGVAQLGTLTAGTGADPDPSTGAAGQITVDARALTITTALARDGGIAATASAGLLQVGTGTAKQAITLTKRNLDGISAGSDTTTDVLRAANLTSNANAVVLLSDTSIDVTTKAKAATDLKLSAAKTIGIVTGEATTGSIGLLAGDAITATTLTAGVDISALGGTTGALTKTDVAITSATAGDDIDLVALNGNVSLTSGFSKSTTGTRGTSVTFGSPGAAGSVAVTVGEDAALALSTIQLRSTAGDAISSTSLSTTEGDVIATAFRDVSITKATANGGNILGSAGRDASLTTGFASGSIGLLAGRTITGGTLNAGVDIAARGGTTGAPLASDVTITSATAGDDIDLVALNGNVSLTSGSSKNSAGTRGTSVTFSSPGAVGSVAVASGEDAALALSTIRLRSATADVISTTNLSTTEGDVVATAFRDVSITKATANGGNLLGSAGRNVGVTTGSASGSIGLLAGGTITGGTLNAGVDIAARSGTTGAPLASDVTITSATAGDDIDLAALNGNVSLTSGSSKNSAGTRGTSVTFGSPGTVGSVAVASGEDAALALSTIRLRSATADVISATNLSTTEGDVVATAFRDVSITKATANGGNILGSAGRDASLTTGFAGGSIGLLAGRTITGGTLNAGVDIAARGGTTGAPLASDVTITSATAGDDIDLVALNGNVSLTSGSSKNSAGTRGTSVTFSSPGAVGSVAVASGEDAALALSTIRLRSATADVISTTNLSTTEGDVVATAFRDVSITKATANGGNLLGSAGRNVGVTTGSASGSIGLLAGNTITGGNLNAGVDVTAKAGNGATITSATAGDDIDLLTDAGNINLATGQSNGVISSRGTSVSFGTPGAAGSVTVGSGETADLALSTIRLRAETGSVTSSNSLTTLKGDVVATALRDVTLAKASATGGNLFASAGGNLGVTTGDATGSIGLLAAGTVTAGTLGAGVDVAAKGGAGVAITSATAGDDIDLLADTGAVSLATGLSNGASAARGTSVTFATPGAKGSVAVASSEESQLGRSTIRLRAATGNVTSATSLTTKQGDVIANAALKVTLGDVNAAGGSVAALTGSEFKADTITASEDIAVATKGNLTVTKSLTAGDDIALSAVDTVTIGSDGASIKEPATGRDTRSAKLTLADAGKLSGVQFETESAAATKGSSITLEGSDVAIGGKIDALTGTIRLRNTGTGTVSIGDPGTGSTAAFKVDNTEFGRLAADTVLVDSGNKAVTIGTLDVAETTGKVATRLLGTGNVFEVTGVVTVKGTASRTLQIGGQDGDPGKIDTLASQILMVIDGDKRPKILGPSATIDLRGDKILFGTAAMRADTLDKSDAEVAQQVASVDSKLYTDPTAQTVGVFMTAKAMKLSYKSFALFQNTRISSSVGVEINSIENGLPNQSDLALQLFSAGDSPTSNSFAMFGVVNNFRLNTAAILSNKVIQLSDPADTNNISRVNRSNSRINGCVIGAPDKGCLTTDVAQPKFNFYDERKVALFDAGDSATIAVSPLIGRGNDGLIVDVANAPVDIDSIECRPDDSSCTANKGN